MTETKNSIKKYHIQKLLRKYLKLFKMKNNTYVVRPI